MEIIDYTIWSTATGEIHSTGRAAGKVSLSDGQEVFFGAQINSDSHAFDPATALPMPRTTPKPLDPADAGVLINRERQRRIEAGKSFGGVWVTGSDKDITNLTSLAFGAQMRIGMGDTTATAFRDGANVLHDLTPAEILALWQQASAHVSAIYAASWVLKAMDPIPHDFADDGYWP